MFKLKYALGLLLFALPQALFSHVKWFSDFSFADQPLSLSETMSPTFWTMAILSIVVICILIIVDKKIENLGPIKRLTERLSQFRPKSVVLLRAATAAVLLLSFQANALFVPELKISHSAIIWLQFFLAVLLISSKTTPLAGVGMLVLLTYGFIQFGFLHLLDYALVLGVAYYFIVQYFKSEKVKDTGMIALYVTAGFSLCWVAIEKLIYPQWSLYILEQNPQLALGLNFDFFLTSAAFIEFSLGFLMIICLLQRPLALVATAVFISTTMVFGKTEVIGHTLLHAILVVFLIEGPGKFFLPPVRQLKRVWIKIIYAVGSFVALLFCLLLPYQYFAEAKHEYFVQYEQSDLMEETSTWESVPAVGIEVKEDNYAGYNVHIQTSNFTFSPANASSEALEGEGHAHIYVNGQKISRVYGSWFHLNDLDPGENTITVTLNGNDHKQLMYESEPIKAEVELEVKELKSMSDHM